MAAPFTNTPQIGVDLNNSVLAADLVSGADKADARLGSEVFTSNGLVSVYAQAGGTISASTAACIVSPTTFITTATTGGTWTSPPVAMAVGDRGWFTKASV